MGCLLGENLAADVVLAAIPTTFIWNLRMSLKRRIYLSALLGLGSMFVGIPSLIL
jgi:hypothetical protein